MEQEEVIKEVSKPLPSEQKQIIDKLQTDASSSYKQGQPWFLMCMKWWKEWILYTSGRIDTRALLEKGKLKASLIEEEDYHLLCEAAWNKLVEWYGGGPPVVRHMIYINNQFTVEVYPLTIQVRKSPLASESFWLECSKASNVKLLRHKIAMIMHTPPHNIRLWKLSQDNEPELIKEIEDIEEALLGARKNQVWVEVKGPFGDWKTPSQYLASIRASAHSLPSSTSSTINSNSNSNSNSLSNVSTDSNGASSSSSSVDRAKTKNENGKAALVERGITGLENLGNTCFMNSALQCLSNTYELTEYFLRDEYKRDINPTNPLGMQGKIAEYYANLLKKLWSGYSAYVSPSDFKWILGKFAPQFTGYRQHDSQELLAFLLDGLHEDLNRVINKPYTETVDTKGMSDREAAALAWSVHLKRNQSVIVDLFQGQLKSTLHCPRCNNISITFDPFMYLSLPLPAADDRCLEVVLWGAERIVRYAVRVPKRGKILHLKQSLAELSDVPVEHMIAAEIHVHRIHAIHDDTRPLSSIRDSDFIIVYEMTGEKESRYVEVVNSPNRDNEFFGIPMLLCVTATTTNSELLAAIQQALRRSLDVSMDKLTVKICPESYCALCKSSLCSGCIIHSDTQQVPQHLKRVALLWTHELYTFHDLDKKQKKMIETHASFAVQKERMNAGLTLEDCFKLFLEKEKLSPNDAWYCPVCKDFQQATKKFDIFKLPKILVIHLKRFQYNKFWREKIDAVVNYPVEGMNLAPLTLEKDSSAVYDLYAISNHMGGLSAGHYTAYALNHYNNKWFLFNDSSVHKVQQLSEIQSIKGAYLLFYRKRS